LSATTAGAAMKPLPANHISRADAAVVTFRVGSQTFVFRRSQ
jgi:hypothetical protein